MFKNPFSFEGRIRRSEYGLSYIVYLFFAIAINIAIVNFHFPVFIYLLWLPMLWFMLAQGAKRCHDRGNSGFFQLIPFYVLWMIFADGEPQTNFYGDDPKGRGNLIENFLTQPA